MPPSPRRRSDAVVRDALDRCRGPRDAGPVASQRRRGHRGVGERGDLEESAAPGLARQKQSDLVFERAITATRIGEIRIAFGAIAGECTVEQRLDADPARRIHRAESISGACGFSDTLPRPMASRASPTSPSPSIPASSFLKLAGPGLVVAATGIGSGDVVSATVGGARYGVVLLWAIALGAFFKFVLSEGIARWQLATGQTVIEGWAEHLHASVKFYFGVYLVLWTVAVSAALTNACGLGLANLTGGAVPQSWGAVLHSLVGFAFVWLGGYGKFEKLMKLLVGVMGFSILVCAALTMTNPGPALTGLVLPTIPAGSGTYVLSLIGGIGGSVTMLSYNYWMREEGMRGSGYLSYVRGDVAIAYVFTAMFGISIMLIANTAFFLPAWRSATPRRYRAWRRSSGPSSVRSASGPTGSDSGRRSSPRSSACGRACRISTPTSTG